MARQSSFLKLEGTIGDVTFYKGANGSFARQKGGISKSRILNDPNFQRTRENLAEFARAAGASQLLKNAFREITLRSRDLRTHNRLYALAMKVIKSDIVSPRGERTFALGDPALINGFHFNVNSLWSTAVFVQHTLETTPTDLTVAFPEFVPGIKLAKPMGASHARIFLVATAINLADATYETNMVSSAEIEINQLPLTGFQVTIPKILTPDTTQIYAIGVEYMQEVNGDMYPLNDKSHNSAKIIFIE
jgi:hypothetical protein